MSWTLLFQTRSRLHQGEKVESLYSLNLGVTVGTLYKSITEYYDHIAPHLIKEATESVTFAGPGGGGGGGVVTVTPVPATSLFGSVTAVPTGIETDIITLVVPSGHTAFLSLIEMSGNNVAIFRAYINNTLQSQGVLSIAGPFNTNFTYAAGPITGIPLNAGDTVRVTVTNVTMTSLILGVYNARIEYVLN